MVVQIIGKTLIIVFCYYVPPYQDTREDLLRCMVSGVIAGWTEGRGRRFPDND